MPLFERPPLETLAPAREHETSWPAAFQALSLEPNDDGTLVRKILKQKVEETRMLRRMPDDLKNLFEGLDEAPEDAPDDHPLQPRSEA